MNPLVGRCAGGVKNIVALQIARLAHSSNFVLKFGKVRIMTISTMTKNSNLFLAAAMFALAVAAIGCSQERKTDKQPPKKIESVGKGPIKPPSKSAKSETPPVEPGQTVPKPESAEERLNQDLEQAEKKPRDLGPPLVDDINALKRLVPDQPIWIDSKNKHVVIQGEVCTAGYPLEFFATYSNRSYESVTAVNVKPSIVHAALLAVGAEPGHPARFQPKFEPPTGTEVAIEVRWKDARGKLQSTPAQNWIRNIKTKKQLDPAVNWVFAGSLMMTDETTGVQYYQADSGELICVLSLPTAMLDLPIRSYGALEARSFEAFEERLPPQGTSITMLLKPILTGKRVPPPPAYKSSGKSAVPVPVPVTPAEAERKAVEIAEAWLALADRAEYSQAWDTAAGRLKEAVARRDFIKQVGAVRKPLGAVKSRQLSSKKYVTSLPGAPDGQYVVLQFKTSFANRKEPAVETITPMLDRDKKWRVSGYYIK